MPTLTIDHRSITVPQGTKVIEAAEQLGIMIPRFCYHPALGAVGACRVCAVKFMNGPVKGIQMSCMVAAQDEMVVSTTDAQVVDFRRHILEFLMLHHPHDCPVCDEGGHCLLQEMTVSGGHGLRRYAGAKRTHNDQDLGPLVQHEMNRCIQCYRCVRYYREYSGYPDLGVMGIGSRVYFGRQRSGTLQSPFAGNLIDICPTGVYTDKPSRFAGRRWDMQRAESVCTHCALGCRLMVSARYRQVVRCEAGFSAPINGHFICDRGRYGHAYASAAERPRRAMLKGQPENCADAVKAARRQLDAVSEKNGAASVAMIGSARSSLETLTLLAGLAREKNWPDPVFGSDDRVATHVARAVRRLTPDLAACLEDVRQAEDILVIGADPLNEAPMLALALRQAGRKGARITVVDPRPVRLPVAFTHLALRPQAAQQALSTIIDALSAVDPVAVDHLQAPMGSEAAQNLERLAKQLAYSRRAMIICGTQAVTAQSVELAADLSRALSAIEHRAGLFFTLPAANSFAVGMLTRAGNGYETLLAGIEQGEVKALIVCESDLHANAPDRFRLQAALDRLELLVVLDHVASDLVAAADVFIPTRTVFEDGGGWINQEGRLQTARPVLAGGEPIALSGGGNHPPRVFNDEIAGDDPVSAGSVLAALALPANAERSLQQGLLNRYLSEFFANLPDNGERILADKRAFAPMAVEADIEGSGDELLLLTVDWTFGTETRSAQSAALTAVGPAPVAVMHPDDARQMGLSRGQQISIANDAGTIIAPLETNADMARGIVVIPRHRQLDWQKLSGSLVPVSPGRIQVADEKGINP